MKGLVTLFVLGKGGTGKSTCAALLALALAGQGKQVALASLDDAHNQSDIFEQPISDRPVSLLPGLDGVQVDRDREIRQYLGQTAAQVKRSFSYLTAFNLDHYFDVLKFSPGMEEYALVTAFTGLSHRFRDYDYLIADMPPTALSLRFFNLPALSLAWISRLEKLRLEIREKKQVISTIRLGKKEVEQDKILSRIREIKAEHEALLNRFQDPGRSRPVVVTNPDRLAGAETQRIFDQLDTMGIRAQALVLNHRTPAGPANIPACGLPREDLPFSQTPLIGVQALEAYLGDHGLSFNAVLG